MKKLTALLLSALLVFLLAACGNNNQNTVQDTSVETKTETSVPETDNSPENAKENGDGDAENREDAGPTRTEDSKVTDTAQPESEEMADVTKPESGEAADNAEAESGKVLIAYFSVMETDGTDTVAGASRVAVNGEVLGNNAYIAQIIQRETGGDLFAIETMQDYPTTHEPLLEFAYDEKADNARPELATQIENLDSYAIIFVGYPNWNADLPMPLYTFLEQYDFGGKTIIPFTTHGGSGFSRTVQTIAQLQPKATVRSDGLSISRNSVAKAESEVVDWVNGLDLTTK